MAKETEKMVQRSEVGLSDIQPGDTVSVRQKIKESGKERIQAFEGIVIARKHGKGISSTITVRKVVQGVGVERIFPVHSPLIAGISVISRGKVRRAKLYYLRTAAGKKARLKHEAFSVALSQEAPASQEETSTGAPDSTEVPQAPAAEQPQE